MGPSRTTGGGLAGEGAGAGEEGAGATLGAGGSGGSASCAAAPRESVTREATIAQRAAQAEATGAIPQLLARAPSFAHSHARSAWQRRDPGASCRNLLARRREIGSDGALEEES